MPELTLEDAQGQMKQDGRLQQVATAPANDTREVTPEQSAIPPVKVDWRDILRRLHGGQTTVTQEDTQDRVSGGGGVGTGVGAPVDEVGARGYPRMSPGESVTPATPPAKRMATDEVIIELLARILEATVEPPAGLRDGPAANIQTVTVSTAGTPVEGPDVAVPKGYVCSVRQRYHATDRTGYVGFSEQGVKLSAARIELRNQVSVDFRRVRNMSELWFDADTASTVFELVAEH